MPREAEGHDEGPGAADDSGRVGKHRAGAEIDLSGFAGGKVQADGGFRERFPFQRGEHPAHRRVAAGVAVFALQDGVDDDAGNALGMPGGHPLAERFQAGNGRAGPLRGGQGAGNGDILGQRDGGVQPAPGAGQRPKGGRRTPPHETALGNVAVGIALTHAHQGLSVVVHFDLPPAHQPSGKKPPRVTSSG